MTAIRLARGATGRDLLVKFAGHYHGHSDGLLAEAGSGVATLALPGSAGVPAPIAAQTLVLPYNDLDAVARGVRRAPARIAAVIVEAAAANMGVVAPAARLQRARSPRIAHAHGALLILDEVLTGFRVGPAGWWGLEAAAVPRTVTPDLITFGKVIGGGLPLAALGGRADLMDLLAPLGPVYQAGTLSGNPLAVAAGLATLRARRRGRSTRASTRRPTSVADAADRRARRPRASRTSCSAPGNLFSIAFRDRRRCATTTDAQAQEAFRYPPFFHAMLDAGRLAAAVGVRGVVRLRRARDEALARIDRRAARRGARRG